MGVILELSGIVSTLFRDPLFLPRLQVALEIPIIFAYDPLRRIIEAVTDIVRSLRDVLETIDIVTDESLAIRSQTLHLLSVESPILYGAIVPLLVLELKIIVEEVLARDQLSSVPFGNVPTLHTNRHP